jgi:hypothetical protein
MSKYSKYSKYLFLNLQEYKMIKNTYQSTVPLSNRLTIFMYLSHKKLTDSGHLLAGEILGAPLLGNVVVQVATVGLHGGHVQLNQVACKVSL